MKTIIDIKNLSYFYNNEENILENINLKINKNDLVAITGHNGSGKTTLIKIVLGLLKAKKGEIKIKGKLSYIPQKNNQDYNFPAKVREILDLECCNCHLRDEVLSGLQIENLVEKQFKYLSGGQQQRVLVALSLLMDPDILILDEPIVGIDSNTQKEFYKLLKRLNEKRNLTILFVTHDISVLNDYFNKVIFVENKKVIVRGDKNV